MYIEKINLYNLLIPFKSPFKFAGGEYQNHSCLIVAIHSEGLTGWGECPTFEHPFYTYETIKTTYHVLTDFLIPSLLKKEINSPQEFAQISAPVRGHNMAKSALDCALWDLFAQANNLSLQEYIGGIRDKISVGVAVSLEKDLEKLLTKVNNYVDEGYQRIKVKISKDWALQPLEKIRKNYPDLMIMADANSVFSLEDLALFKQLDQLNLLMIEQPLGYDDLLEHSYLQSQIKTPICLDESINSVNDTRNAIKLKSCQIVNLKPSRVGGVTNTLKIHQICQQTGIKLWCGGMLESGIGRALNLHISSLENFQLPADISATNRYFHEDITTTNLYLNQEDSTINIPKQRKGIGVEINPEMLIKYSNDK
ncbi:MAG: o-succinylbenzoate synthase [Cyanobacterium sp. T60_A2020_053]|nr:o-succinylbenzoate synthase [Cyanobacterium sp. T60_A2020_053]